MSEERTTGFCAEHDATYYLDTLEWCGPVCGDDGCEFCKDRPEKYGMLKCVKYTPPNPTGESTL